MKVLGLDFETQDAEPKTTRVTEVGAALYQWNGFNKVTAPLNESGALIPQFQKLKGFSAFCWEPGYPPQSQKIVELTGITDEMLRAQGKPRRDVFVEKLLPLVREADLVIAHKTAFDWTILKATSNLFGLEVPDKELLCTLSNFPWPSKFTCHKLGHLAWEHDILVKASSLHRAENDVDLMMQVLSLYNFEDVLAYARLPWRYFKADIVGPWVDGGVQNGIAKELGFNWEKVKGTDWPVWNKTWVTRVKIKDVESLKKQASTCVSPFRVAEIEGIS